MNHFTVQQKLTQHGNSTILQLKKKKRRLRKELSSKREARCFYQMKGKWFKKSKKKKKGNVLKVHQNFIVASCKEIQTLIQSKCNFHSYAFLISVVMDIYSWVIFIFLLVKILLGICIHRCLFSCVMTKMILAISLLHRHIL